MKHKGPLLLYSAKEGYQAESVPVEYERERFSGFLGRYRYAREQRAVSSIIDMLPGDIEIADCPCGNGRWWSVLARRAKRIVALDISQDMLNHAKKQVPKFSIDIEVKMGDAEDLCLESNSVDYTFSHALTKHLPIPIQYKVLAEFSRVARQGVICSFGIFSHINYAIWRHRHIEESYPTFLEEVEWMAKAANLKIKTMRKCTTPIGVEYTVLFEKL